MIDVVRDDLLVEIQTGSFAAMGNKLDRLLAAHRVLLVHPIAASTHLVKPDGSRRKSPKKGSVYNLFDELVSIPTLLDHPHLELEIAVVAQEKQLEADPTKRRGRGGWRTVDRRLVEVLQQHRFATVSDLVALLPADLPAEFTTADIAVGAGVGRDIAQRMAYCFRALEYFVQTGRTRAGYTYRLADR